MYIFNRYLHCCRHLTKLFDSMAKLKFRKEPGKEKVALGMIAKDGEYVEFSKECDCTGPVSPMLHFV